MYRLVYWLNNDIWCEEYDSSYETLLALAESLDKPFVIQKLENEGGIGNEYPYS